MDLKDWFPEFIWDKSNLMLLNGDCRDDECTSGAFSFRKNPDVDDPDQSAWNFPDANCACLFAKEIAARIVNPFMIMQVYLPYCGQAAILFELVRRNPLLYLTWCIECWTRGRITSFDHTYHAGDVLNAKSFPDKEWYNSKVSASDAFDDSVSKIDWIMMVTMRNDLNWFFDNSPDEIASSWGLLNVAEWDIEGMTMPGGMADMASDFLGVTLTREGYVFSTEETALQDAGEHAADGRVAFLNIDAELLDPAQSGFPWITPNHWCSIISSVATSVVSKSDPSLNSYTFFVYSWGTDSDWKVALPMQVQAKDEDVDDDLWGVMIDDD
jgi:hypothetical protein